ncbi:hypothetical protein [Dyadobacter sp. 676]|uniref:VWA domain-containing protein n=1 Tax=Dyadobacter sp. 676 TaxID=3088362 RepID=A0AAU8FGE8_9BACT
MIETDFNWTEPLNLLLIFAMLALLALQCGLLVIRHRHSSRMAIRLVLNGFLWLVVLAWILDPCFKSAREAEKGLLVGGNVPRNVFDRLRDSLPDARVLSPEDVRNAQVDTLVIAGQAFDEAVFAAIRQSRIGPGPQWLPYFAPDEFHGLWWHGLLEKGGLQRVEGSIESSRKQPLLIRYADQTLDSIMLNPGNNRFRLAFPAFGEGRTTITLHLNDRVVDTLRFFVQPERKLAFRFLLDHPDFETRTLATWLGKQGHSVQYDATLSRNIRSSLNINRVTEPDIIITNTSNARNAVVRKVVNEGKSVIFIQSGDPVAGLHAINNALGTRFQAVKISNEAVVPVSIGLTAMPFRFEPGHFMQHVPHYPVAVGKTTGKVAASLLNETFPLQLSGDSITYGKVWNEILAYVRPAPVNAVRWDAPVFKNVPVTIHLNNFGIVPPFLAVGRDTVFTMVSALNDRSASASLLPVQEGWVALGDSLSAEMYVQDYSPLRYASRLRHFMRSSPENTLKKSENAVTGASRKLPGWVWFGALVLCLAAVWIEPKLR